MKWDSQIAPLLANTIKTIFFSPIFVHFTIYYFYHIGKQGAITTKTISCMLPENPLFCHRPVNVHIDIHTVLWQHLVVSYFAALRRGETQLWNCDAHKQEWQSFDKVHKEKEENPSIDWVIDTARLETDHVLYIMPGRKLACPCQYL